jgi:hypothetical protein
MPDRQKEPKKTNADAAAAKERQLAPLREHAFKRGQSGNPAGRPKGSRNKLTTEFFDAFYEAWQRHGAKALKEVAETTHATLCGLRRCSCPKNSS